MRLAGWKTDTALKRIELRKLERAFAGEKRT